MAPEGEQLQGLSTWNRTIVSTVTINQMNNAANTQLHT